MSDRPLVFLDLDGVVVDFLGGVCRCLGRDPSTLPTGTYDLPTLFNTSWERLDAHIRPYSFWYDLEPMPYAKEIVEILRTVGDVVVLSSPWPQSSASHVAKLDWCERRLGIPHSDVILTPCKHLLAAPGRLLVDDHHGNCEKWSSLGGHAIHMPCHHNKDTVRQIGHSTLCHLAICLEQMLATEAEGKRRRVQSQRN